MYLYRVLYLLSVLLIALAVFLEVPGGTGLSERVLPWVEYLDFAPGSLGLLAAAVVGLLFARILQVLTAIRAQLTGIYDLVSDQSDYPI